VNEVPLWVWSLLGALLCGSGLCSASETALFSLDPSERARAGRATERLLEQPRNFLVTVLLANLTINILFFAFADRLIPEEGEGWAEFSTTLGVLVVLLVCGEILPKTVGLRARLPLARFVAPLWAVAVQFLAPVRRPLVSLLDLAGRVVNRAGDERQLTSEELADVLERSAAEGGLLDHEADLISEIVELRSIRVRELMLPRVDALFLERSGEGREAVVRQAVERRVSWLVVTDGSADRVVGQVRVRDLLVYPTRTVEQLLQPTHFVPEVASAMDLLRVLREQGAPEAVVVDEWGGTAGVVTMEDVVEEIVGDLRQEGESRQTTVVPLGEGVFRVPGSLSLRDWNQSFGHRVVPTEFETVGGFVTALLGRIPRAGDVVSYGGLTMEVEAVRGRRVMTVDIQVARPVGPASGATLVASAGEAARP
jgi:putative hemolysin